MIYKVLLSLAVAFGFFWIAKTKKPIPAIITIGMVAGVIPAIFLDGDASSIGIYIYMGFVIVAFIYGLFVQNKTQMARITICLMSGTTFLYWLWILNHWHGNTLLAPVIIILVGIGALLTKVKLKPEVGFLTILFIDALTIVLENVIN